MAVSTTLMGGFIYSYVKADMEGMEKFRTRLRATDWHHATSVVVGCVDEVLTLRWPTGIPSDELAEFADWAMQLATPGKASKPKLEMVLGEWAKEATFPQLTAEDRGVYGLLIILAMVKWLRLSDEETFTMIARAEETAIAHGRTPTLAQ